MSTLSTLRNNKGKILLGTGLVAGLCYYFRDYYQIAYAVYEMMNEEPPVEAPRVINPEREEKYKRTLNLADESAQNQLCACCKTTINTLYHSELDRVQNELRSPDVDDKTKKLLFAELQSLCFSRTVLTITLVVLVTLYARVQSCILARSGSSENREALKSLVAACDVSKDEEAIRDLDNAVRSLVAKTLNDYPPTSEVTASDYTSIVTHIFNAIPSISFRLITVPSSSLCLTEGRELQDLLNSPHWRQAVEISMSRCCNTFINRTVGEGCFVMATRIGSVKSEFDFVSRGQSQYISQVDTFGFTEEFFGLDEPSDGPSEKALLEMIEKMTS